MQNPFIAHWCSKPASRITWLFGLALLLTTLPARGQYTLLLKNTRSGRQKVVRPGNLIKVWYRAGKPQPIHQSFLHADGDSLTYFDKGRVVAVTDSSLTYQGSRKRTFTVPLSSITALQKHSFSGSKGILAGTALSTSLVISLVLFPGSGIISLPTLLGFVGSNILNQVGDRVVYPMRNVQNQSVWQLEVVTGD